MQGQNGTEPVEDDELLFRRIPASQNWYQPSALHPLSPAAFGPHKDRDSRGISVWRAKYRTIDEAARGQPGKAYYVAILRAGRLREAGVEVLPDVEDSGPGHCVLPQLNAAQRRSDEVAQLKWLLAESLVESVAGPFETPGDAQRTRVPV